MPNIILFFLFSITAMNIMSTTNITATTTGTTTTVIITIMSLACPSTSLTRSVGYVHFMASSSSDHHHREVDLANSTLAVENPVP